MEPSTAHVAFGQRRGNRIAADVYAALPAGADPARQLHAFVRRVRDDYAGNSPLLWASHLHIGPRPPRNVDAALGWQLQRY